MFLFVDQALIKFIYLIPFSSVILISCNCTTYLKTLLCLPAVSDSVNMERGQADEEQTQAGSSCPPSVAPDPNNEAELSMAMVWSIQEAVERQTLQIGVSACGATAVVDVLQALGITVAAELVDGYVRTHLRRNESPLPDYLHSRSEAGRLNLHRPSHTNIHLHLFTNRNDKCRPTHFYF